MLIGKQRYLIQSAPNHTYQIEQYPAPSCTEVVGTMFGVNRYFTEESRLRGELAHLAIRYDMEGKLEVASCSAETIGFLYGARKFVKHFNLEPVLIEAPVGALNPLFGGTMDILFRTPQGVYWLVDWKTGEETSAVQIQLAGYAIGIEEMYGFKNIKRMPVYLTTNGEYLRRAIFYDPLDLEAFRACHTIWKWKELYGK